MSSEALERALATLHVIVGEGPEALAVTMPSDEAAALLAEVARVEQERDEASALSVDDAGMRIAAEAERDEALAALAVAREREQRLRAAISSALTSLATGPAKEGYAYSLLRAALVDEPAAATRLPHQALGRCLCGACHTIEEAIELNYAAATLAERECDVRKPGRLSRSASAAADEPRKEWLARLHEDPAADEPGETP